MTTAISHASWLKAPQTQALIAALEAARAHFGRVDVVINPDATLLNMGAAVVSTLLSHLNVPMHIRGRFEDLPPGIMKPAAHFERQRR